MLESDAHNVGLLVQCFVSEIFTVRLKDLSHSFQNWPTDIQGCESVDLFSVMMLHAARSPILLGHGECGTCNISVHALFC